MRLLTLFLVLAATLQAAVPLENPRITGSDAKVNSGTFTIKSGATLATEAGAVFSFAEKVPLSAGGTGVSLTDPGADRIPFWDDSAGAITWLTAGTGLTITGTTITASAAPLDATYITQTANGTLTNEQALSSLSTGLLKVTTSTGVLSSITTSAGVAGSLSDETGTNALVFNTSPAFATDIGLPTGSSVTTSAAGRVAFDTDAHAASRGAVQVYDGTANTYLVGVLASDTPTNGQVPTWNTGGTITWETASGGGGSIGGSTGSTDNALIRADGTGGATVQSSNVTLADSGTALVFSGAGGITAGGSNQDNTLTPSGTGTNVLVNGARIGTASSTAATGPLVVYGTDTATATVTVRRADASTGSGAVYFSKSRGTIGSPSAPNSADRLGALAAGGYNGSTWVDTQALFGFTASEAWSSGAMGTSFALGLTPNTTTTRADVLTVQGTGLTQIGAGSPAAGFLDSTQRLIIPRDSSSNSVATIVASGTSTDRPISQFLRSRGTMASPSATASGDYLWSVRIGGHDGTNMVQGGEIAAIVDGTVSTGVVPQRLDFYTTATDSAARAVRVSIKSNGQVAFPASIASTSTTTGTAVVTGGVGVSGALYVGGVLNFATSTPASASAAGVTGTIAWDSSYIYICTATNTWKRVAIATW